MTRKRKPYKTYTKEFKAEAVKLMEESDCPAAEIALGIKGVGDKRFSFAFVTLPR